MCAAASALGADRPHGVARQRGASLVELVMFILIVGVALAAVVGALGLASQRSAEPQLARQALAVAESLLEEVLALPFERDDPDGGVDGIGPDAGETRGGALRFDHVNDYHGLVLDPIAAIDGTPLPALAGLRAEVAVAAQAIDNIAAGDGLLVTVRVTGPAGIDVRLAGLRARQSP